MNRINKRLARFTPKEQKTALKGYLKTYRIDGRRGYDPNTFIINIKPKVLNIIKSKQKPIKVKFIKGCLFIKDNVYSFGYLNTFVEVITDTTDSSDLYFKMIQQQLELI